MIDMSIIMIDISINVSTKQLAVIPCGQFRQAVSNHFLRPDVAVKVFGGK